MQHHRAKLMKNMSTEQYLCYKATQNIAKAKHHQAVSIVYDIVKKDEKVKQCILGGVSSLFPNDANAARLFEECVLEIYSQDPDGEIIRGNMIDYSMLGLDMEGEDNNDD